MRFLYLVVLSLLLGLAVGHWTSIEAGLPAELTLYLLIFIIGLDVGRNRAIAGELRELGPLGVKLPLATILGSLSGGAVAALIGGVPLKWGLAISAGFGWYSLTGPLLAQYSPLYGVLGFTANLTREIFTILIYPLVIKHLPKELAVSMGGATTMDSTLPVMVKFGGSDVTLVAFVHGFILTSLAPVLIPLILGL
ncbi:lysine exporter LysO family protein [Palaeococcus ferrophilus]|uniref:lysine exporter LysO family protein n=1 Tax=Palaeococcus ferrophilus TaxID=83868 RepID=UPI00064F1DDE|nr:lysine exporter LysO family protein [Palaeococcus ferrophilus]